MMNNKPLNQFNLRSQNISNTIDKIDGKSCYRLVWRQKILIVKALSQPQVVDQPATIDQQHLIQCLLHSPVKRVKLDLTLSVEQIEQWSHACQFAGKQIFLSLPSASDLPQKRNRVCWRLKRSLEWMTALLLVLGLTPLMSLIAISLKLGGFKNILTSQWIVGERGRLFQIYRFQTPSNPWGHWMRRFRLDKLPQLGQVLRGEMGLIGPRSYSLAQATQLDPTLRPRLNALPGITGLKWRTLDLNVWSRCDLCYLSDWSLAGDALIFLSALPRLMLGIKFEQSSDGNLV